ncbi:CinA family protein [Trinickia diaoshuihuensis]|uniref:CinA family protein n=1 Tax=Trinickia diaoshuihuensis TaxID=2292265 RepID=UPI000E22A4A5|nr:CinA family protein [Trinickia diaoshuihuensis]
MSTEQDVVSFLTEAELKLATAESCTGGLIAASLAAVPGSGKCLDVGFVAYSPSAKAGLLGVRQETMDRFGLTSEEVAREMAEGALASQGCCADVAVSNTGVADPVGDGKGPPPGTQCFAWSWRLEDRGCVTFSETARFACTRNEIRETAARYALSRIEHYFGLLPRPISDVG